MKERKTKMRTYYEIAFNTGDEYWDNEPGYEYFDTIEEVKAELEKYENHLTDEKIEELERTGTTHDDDYIEWEITRLAK